jgi:hypothetical protein
LPPPFASQTQWLPCDCGFAKDKPRLIQRVACADGLALLARHKRVFAAVVLLSAVGTDAVVLRVVPNAAALPA